MRSVVNEIRSDVQSQGTELLRQQAAISAMREDIAAIRSVIAPSEGSSKHPIQFPEETNVLLRQPSQVFDLWYRRYFADSEVCFDVVLRLCSHFPTDFLALNACSLTTLQFLIQLKLVRSLFRSQVHLCLSSIPVRWFDWYFNSFAAGPRIGMRHTHACTDPRVFLFLRWRA